MLIRILSTLSILLMSGINCSAQTSSQYEACSQTANTQMAMNQCASEEAKRADNELNQLYRQMVTTTASNLIATKKLKAAEVCWIAYRDSYLNAVYPESDKQTHYGSMFPMEFDLLRAELTRQHINDLMEMQKHW